MIWTSSGRGWHDDHRLQPQLECQGACGEQKIRTILVRFFKEDKYCLILNVKGPAMNKKLGQLSWDFLDRISSGGVRYKAPYSANQDNSGENFKERKWIRMSRRLNYAKYRLYKELMKRQLTLCFNFLGRKKYTVPKCKRDPADLQAHPWLALQSLLSSK